MRIAAWQVSGWVVALLLAAGTLCDAATDVRVNINLGPPPIVVAEPPAVVLVPGSDVYFVPEYDFDIFYYDGYWWSPRGERWYRSRAYNGPWRVVSRKYIPAPVYRVPRDYRHVYVQEERIPYGQWKKHKKDHHRGGRGGKGERHGDDHRGRGRHHDDDHSHGHDDHGRDDHRGRGGHR